MDLREFATHREDYDKRMRKQYFFDRMPVFLEYLQKLILKDDFMKHSMKKLLTCDIICDIDFLHKALKIPGDADHKFCFVCTKYKGNIYIHEHLLKSTPRDYNNILVRHVFCTGKKISFSIKMRNFDCDAVYSQQFR